MFYPEHRHMMAWAAVRRERLLPDNAIGTVESRKGQHVNLRDVVARGSIPARYVFVDVAPFFRRKPDADVSDLIRVEVGEEVEAGKTLAGRYTTRGKRLFSPVTGIVLQINQGRVVIQETPESIDVEAGLVGQVVATQGSRGVLIEAFGALVQGVWGNNRRLIGPLRMEPDDGLEAIFDDTLNRQYAGSIVVTRRALKSATLDALDHQNIGGVIAPSMDASEYDRALGLTTAIVLLEGFGDIRLSPQTTSLLEGFVGRQTTVDAILPNRWDSRRPEVFINLPAKSGERPPEPNLNMTLQPGMSVRLTRDPHVGVVGQITHLPKTPQLLENGLRVPCAQVDLVTGEKVLVPLANLEVFGR
ncbi:MAG: hypothetical protein K8I30_12125 [Anaerolineae bacterium]|nr:hypothetical protein [Anaerolineae bacterium]